MEHCSCRCSQPALHSTEPTRLFFFSDASKVAAKSSCRTARDGDTQSRAVVINASPSGANIDRPTPRLTRCTSRWPDKQSITGTRERERRAPCLAGCGLRGKRRNDWTSPAEGSANGETGRRKNGWSPTSLNFSSPLDGAPESSLQYCAAATLYVV